jgi:hypothetical protein
MDILKVDSSFSNDKEECCKGCIQGANNYYSCAQRTCGNADAPQKIIQATAEAGDARHAHRPSHLWRNCVADAPQDPNQHT